MRSYSSLSAGIKAGVLAVSLTISTSLPILAQTPLTDAARVENGRQMATVWCSHCHVVTPDGAQTAQAGVPSFQDIAAREGQSAERIENAILDPHPPMPDLQLARDELANLALYILSLAPKTE